LEKKKVKTLALATATGWLILKMVDLMFIPSEPTKSARAVFDNWFLGHF